FLWQPLRDVHYNHPMMQRVYTEWELKYYNQTRTFSGWWSAAESNLRAYSSYFLRWLLLPFAVGAFYAAHKRRLRVVLIATLLMLAAITWFFGQEPHLSAPPAAAALLLISLFGFRFMSVMLRRHGHVGLRFARAYILVYAALLVWTQFILVRASAKHPYSWG